MDAACLKELSLFVSHEELMEPEIADRLSPTWRRAIEAGSVARSASGLPILVDQAESLVDIQRLAVANECNNNQTLERVRLHISELCSQSYNVSMQNAERLVRDLSDDQQLIGLVVGGGTLGPGVQQLIDNPSVRLIAFDVYDAKQLTFVADGHWIPFVDDSIDFVWIQAVLEHVADPVRVADECQRVLRPGGLVYAETPFMQQVHAGVHDFTRFTGLGHRMLFRNCDTVASGSIDGPGVALIWALRYFFAGLFRSKNAGRAIGLAFVWLKFFDRIIPEERRQMGAASFFFLGRKRAGKASFAPSEMIKEYRGV